MDRQVRLNGLPDNRSEFFMKHFSAKRIGRFSGVLGTLSLLLAAGMPGCAANESPVVDNSDPVAAILSQPLTALTNQCSFNPTSGLMTVTLVAGETAILGLRAADSAILQNGQGCISTAAGTPQVLAKTTTLKKIVVTGTAGVDHVILDFTNGLFAMGTSSTSTTGIQIDLLAGAGNTVGIRGTTGADTVTFGGTQTILMNTDAYKDIVVTDVGATNTVYTVSLGDGNDTFTASGGTGATGVFGLPVTVFGGAGIDTFNEGAASTVSETLHGGAGVDVLSYASRTGNLTMVLGDATATDGESLELDNLDDDIETVNGGTGNDTFSGTALAHTFNGNAGNDKLLALATVDGAQVFNGGADSDTVDYSARSVAVVVTIDGVAANDGESGETDSIAVDVENIVGSSVADNLTGNLSNNRITGGDGDDTMNGGAGDDIFPQGLADDGADIITGGTGADTIDYSARTAVVVALLDGNATSGETGENDTLGVACVPAVAGCIDVENLWGGSLGDTLTGNSSANELVGGTGDDTLNGLANDDVLEGGGLAETNVLNCGTGDGDIAFGEGTGPGTKNADCEF
jgi:hypothetical protein